MVTVYDIRTQSQEEKAAIVDQRYSKPTTDTSGTATGSKTNSMLDIFGAAIKAGVNPLNAAMSAMDPSRTVIGPKGKSYNYYEQQFKKDVRAGKYATPTTPPKSPTSTTSPGINAPAPDQPWQPSSMSGLQAQEEDPLKRRR
jgi:hypothetical protein